MSAYRHFTAAGQTEAIGGASGSVRLRAVNVNTKAASAVLTLYNGTASTAASLAVIDCATAPISLDYKGLVAPNGLFAVLLGGNADVTVVYE